MNNDMGLDGLNPVRKILIGLGTVLILCGVALLLYFSYVTYQAFHEPQSVPAIAYVIELINSNVPVIKGQMLINAIDGSKHPTDFRVGMSPDIKAIVMIALAVGVFFVFVRIAVSVIQGGVAIIKGAFYQGDIVYKRKHDS